MRRISAAVVLSAAAAVAVVVLSGCGGGGNSTTAAAPTESAPAILPTTPTQTTTVRQATGAAAQRYEQQMQALGNKLSAYFAAVGQADTTAKSATVAANLEEIQVRLRAAAVRLKAMPTPPDVAADQQKLIAAINQYANELDQIIADVKAGHRSALFGISQLAGVRAMSRATTAITNDGYDITGTETPGG